ncbi:hypothetical protein WG66_013373 [Moniliophthora roreri]|nr:hypothetical protein WG66_013373 [Moniliophthora roreri]
MQGIPINKAEFVGLWTESILYGTSFFLNRPTSANASEFYTGMNAVLFSICVWVLVYYKKRTSSGLNIPLLVTAVILYLFCTIRIGIDLGRGIVAFFGTREPVAFYTDISNWSRVFREALYVTNSMVADFLVIYRLYVVWGYNRKITVGPILLLLGSSISGYITVWEISRAANGSIFEKQVSVWATALFSLSMATNIIVTSLIAGRIWYIGLRTSKNLGRQHGVKYSRAFVVIVESGALYSASLFILLILYSTNNHAQLILYNCTSQIVGIAPTLIIVRVGLGLSSQDNLATIATSRLRHRLTDSGNARNPEAVRSNTIPMQIHRVVEMTTDDDSLPHGSKKDFKAEPHIDDSVSV